MLNSKNTHKKILISFIFLSLSGMSNVNATDIHYIKFSVNAKCKNASDNINKQRNGNKWTDNDEVDLLLENSKYCQDSCPNEYDTTHYESCLRKSIDYCKIHVNNKSQCGVIKYERINNKKTNNFILSLN